MIKEIHMCNCASYGADGASMIDCPQICFVYGPNGSGKSTISNYLLNTDDPMFSDCRLEWDSDIHSDILVYNRKFRELNFSGSTDIAGVFTLGQATIEDIKHLDELKETRKARKAQFEKDSDAFKKTQEKQVGHTTDFKETIWNVLMHGQTKMFSEAFTGSRKSKDRFMESVIARYKARGSNICSLEDLQGRCATLFGQKPEECKLFEIQISNVCSSIASVESDPIFQRVVAGNNDIPIGKLINALNNSDWVNRGRQYIGNNDICPFCQKPTVDEALRNQLEAFFSGEYDDALMHIKQIRQLYIDKANYLLSALRAIVADETRCVIGKINISEYTANCQLLESAFAANRTSIDEKLTEPGKVVSIKSTAEIIKQLLSTIENANKAISEHNNMVVNFKREHKKLVDDIWDYLMDQQDALIAGYIKDNEAFEKSLNGMKRKLISLKEELDRLKRNIAEASKNVTSVQPTVDEINRSLVAYGFNNFYIAASPNNANMYQIKRPDGTLASNTLSEGEETFITFLYYLQLAKGATNVAAVSNKRILVIDDPICSLDSTILYVVSAMVKALIKETKQRDSNIEQIFILTHNVFFHKEASFVNGRTVAEKTVNYWIISKKEEISTITAHGQNNPISTSYELLWRELQEDSNSFISIQNAMRRIIENYFGMLGNKKEDYVISCFTSPEEQTICRSLFHWINDGSHSIPDDLYYDSFSSSVDKYKEIFHKIFVFSGNEAHYNMMMGIQE